MRHAAASLPHGHLSLPPPRSCCEPASRCGAWCALVFCAQAVQAMLGGSRHPASQAPAAAVLPVINQELTTLNVSTHARPPLFLSRRAVGGGQLRSTLHSALPRGAGATLGAAVRACCPQISELETQLFGLVLIGRGGGGLVYSAVWQGAQVAVKFMICECVRDELARSPGGFGESRLPVPAAVLACGGRRVGARRQDAGVGEQQRAGGGAGRLGQPPPRRPGAPSSTWRSRREFALCASTPSAACGAPTCTSVACRPTAST